MKNFLALALISFSIGVHAEDTLLSCQSWSEMRGVKGPEITDIIYTISADGTQLKSSKSGKVSTLKTTEVAYEWENYTEDRKTTFRETINRVNGKYEMRVISERGELILGKGICEKAQPKL